MLRKLFVMFTFIAVIGVAAFAWWQTTLSASTGVKLTKPTCEAYGEEGKRTILKVGSPIPKIALKTTDGKPTTLDMYNGKTYRLIEFFASWCPHCQHSVPAIKEVLAKHGKIVTMIGLNGGDLLPNATSTSAAFIEKYHITYPILEGINMPMLQSFCVMGFPVFYLVDKSGYVRWRFSGTLKDKDLAELMAVLAKAPH